MRVAILVLAVAMGLGAAFAPAGTQALERVHTLRWRPSPSTGVEGYRVYLGPRSGSYEAVIDLTEFGLSTQGVAQAQLLLAADRAYYVAMTSLRGTRESVLSNEIFVTRLRCPESRWLCVSASYATGP